MESNECQVLVYLLGRLRFPLVEQVCSFLLIPITCSLQTELGNVVNVRWFEFVKGLEGFSPCADA